MPVTVVKRFLTKKNEMEYKSVFKQCFPDVSWRASVPFASSEPRDFIYAAVDDKVVGFCMVHHEPPEKMKQGSGSYMYNLCVSPANRCQGVGSAILRAVAQDHPVCYAHMEQNGDSHAFMTGLGWQRVGQVRQFFEYALVPSVTVFQPVETACRQYDAVNNVIYID